MFETCLRIDLTKTKHFLQELVFINKNKTRVLLCKIFVQGKLMLTYILSTTAKIDVLTEQYH